jgi:hypothetical protein
MTRPAHRSALCALAALPEPFSYTQARAAGVSDRRLYGLRDAGLIEQMGRGLFRLVDTASDADPDLLEITHRAPAATLCLTTALARHGLTMRSRHASTLRSHADIGIQALRCQSAGTLSL